MAAKKQDSEAGVVRIQPRARVLLLEVSSDWLKLIEVAGDRKGLTIMRAHCARIEPGAVVSEMLQAALKASKWSLLPVLSCIPRQHVNVRLLELPSVDPAEITDMIELQVSRQTPYSLQEILSGFKLVGYTQQGTYTRVLLAIVQRLVVRERYYAIEDAGLTVERMGVSSEGVITWFLYHMRAAAPDQIMLLLDVDSYFTHFIMIQHRSVIATRSLLWGAKQVGDGPDGFASRVQEALRACEDVLQGKAVDKVFVSGAAAARSESMLQALSEKSACPCEGLDVLDGVKIAAAAASSLGKDVREAISLTGLLGMALSPDLLELHFVPDVYAMRQRLLELGRGWGALVAGLAALLVAGSLYLTMATSTRIQQLQALQAELAWLQPDVVQVERMVEIVRETRSRQDAQVLPEDLLPVIHAVTPAGVYLDSLVLQIENGRFTLSGSAPKRSDIRDFIRQLEETPYFGGIEEAGGTAADNMQRFRFQVTGLIRRPLS